MDMKYDVEADFSPSTACNFRCRYCSIPLKIRGAEPVLYGTSDQWQEGFDATGKTWLIHVTGGEPFAIPALWLFVRN